MIKMINIIYRLVAPKFFEEAIEEINIDNVIVRPSYLSICQADQRYYQGKRASDVLEEKLPMALIHEGVGEVVFDNTGSFDVGDKVVMIPNTPTKEDEYISANYLPSSKFRGSGFDGFTSDLIQESIQKYGIPGDFLGHIGGDDFVAIVNYENAKKIGRSVVKNFDARIKKFYNQEDATKGWIRVVNRKGKLEKYPIMTITVAMISNKYKKYNTTLDIGEDGAMIKKKAKTILGSTFLEDRRKNN